MHGWRTAGRGEGLTADREKWEHSWARPAEEFTWFRSRVEPIIVEAAASTDLPPGIAVDVGCGTGHVTRFLGERFPLALGFDHALPAIEQAYTRHRESTARFGVADARMFPVRDSTAALVVDRGCLHCLLFADASKYLNEVARVLAPGGRYVMVARTTNGVPPLHVARRHPLESAKLFVIGRWPRPLGTLARALASPEAVREFLPPTLELERSERGRPKSDAGWRLHHTRLVARRVATR